SRQWSQPFSRSARALDAPPGATQTSFSTHQTSFAAIRCAGGPPTIKTCRICKKPDCTNSTCRNSDNRAPWITESLTSFYQNDSYLEVATGVCMSIERQALEKPCRTFTAYLKPRSRGCGVTLGRWF